MSEYDPWEVRLALQVARQVRTCPPDALVLAEPVGKELEAHLEICEFCRDLRRLGSSVTEMAPMTRIWQREANSAVVKAPREGEVWSLMDSLGGWGPKKCFYNPPMVLVLLEARKPDGAVRVAQVYDDPRLMGPGDLPLGDGLFAECWNTYTFRQGDLDRFILTASPEFLQAVLKMEADSFPSVDEYSPLEAFRRMELEVGAFFSIQAVSALMTQCEASLEDRLRERFPDEASIIELIRRKQPRIIWPSKSFPLIDTLARARLPEDEMPLAASAPGKVLSLNVLHVHLEEGELFLHSSIAFFTVWREEEDGFLIGGRIREELREEAELSARFELPGGASVGGERIFLDAETGHFRAFFPHLTAALADASELVMLVLTG